MQNTGHSADIAQQLQVDHFSENNHEVNLSLS